jgi:DNA-binding PucR family transcriptional regulator
MASTPEEAALAAPEEAALAELREVAAGLLSEVSTLAQEMLDYLLARIPEAGADPEIRGLTLGSCSSNIEAALSMVRHGIPVSATEAPVTALEHARAMAARGHSVDVMLRFYRLGHAFFIERFHQAIRHSIPNDGAALRALDALERFGFEYEDRISTQVAAEYVAELERRQNRARAVRMDAVRALLGGVAVDPDAAERALGHRLATTQLAFVCWAERADLDLAPIAAGLAAALGSQRPLLVSDGAQALWGWVAGTAAATPERARLASVLGARGEPVHVAFGEPHGGPAGFRDSHQEALRARRVVELSGRHPPSATYFSEIALVDALSRDLDAARALVASELGELAAEGAREGEERSALLAVLDAQGGLAAAAAVLGLHRNTVLQRVRRAEERRGPSEERLLELHTALRLTAVLGPAVLRHG